MKASSLKKLLTKGMFFVSVYNSQSFFFTRLNEWSNSISTKYREDFLFTSVSCGVTGSIKWRTIISF